MSPDREGGGGPGGKGVGGGGVRGSGSRNWVYNPWIPCTPYRPRTPSPAPPQPASFILIYIPCKIAECPQGLLGAVWEYWEGDREGAGSGSGPLSISYPLPLYHSPP